MHVHIKYSITCARAQCLQVVGIAGCGRMHEYDLAAVQRELCVKIMWLGKMCAVFP